VETLGDLEGLMSLLYTDVDIKFISRRCNQAEPTTEPTGRAIANECRDMNPGSWHVVTTKDHQRGRRSHPRGGQEKQVQAAGSRTRGK
jgi:hypothetical protein